MKILHTGFYILLIRKFKIVWITTAYFLFCPACKKNHAIDEHPDFINAIYKRMDTTQNQYLDQGFAFIDSAFKALPNPGIGDIFVMDSIKLTKYYYAKHDYKKFIALLDSMTELLKNRTDEEKYAERYAEILYEKGGYYLAMKRYNESMHYISMAEKVVLKMVKNKCRVFNDASVKAYVLFAQEKYLESAASFRTQAYLCLFVCTRDNSRRVIDVQRLQNNVALSYLRAGAIDSATWYQNLALHTITANENKYPLNKNEFAYSKAVIYGDQAEVLALKGYYPQVEALYRKSIAGTSTQDVEYTQSTRARLAAVYLTDKKIDSARLVLNGLKLSLDTVANEKYLLTWYKLTVEYFSKTNQIAKAFQYHQQYQTIRDAASERDKNFFTVDVEKEFENLELKYSNEILQKEASLKNLYLIIIVSIFVLSAVIALFVWYNLKRVRKLHLQVKQKNESMQQTLYSLENSHQENNRIMRIVAHDLKSPISAINNLIYSLLKKDCPPDLKETGELIKNACGNSMTLINEVLHHKKKSAIIKKDFVDMKRLLEYCVDLLQAKADEKNQQLTLQADPVILMANSQKMWRVISNIVNNAIKFSPEHATIDVRLKRNGNILLLSVKDNGIGIPAALKDKIFTLSPEASRPGTSGEESYGLGLSISQNIIQEHEGKIWFDSVDGEGAVFYVELPCLN